jgi:hypothetical protein
MPTSPAPVVAGWPAGGGPRRRICRSLVWPAAFLSPLPLLVLSCRPLFAGVSRPPAAGRPLVAGEGEPQGGGAPGAAPDPQAAVDGPHATEWARCGCGRLLGHRRRRCGWRAAVVGEERRGTTASPHGLDREARVCRRRRPSEAGSSGGGREGRNGRRSGLRSKSGVAGRRRRRLCRYV